MSERKLLGLVVTDIDNTLFDWVGYYVHAFWALLEKVEETIGVPASQLAVEARRVFEDHGSIEYPFLVQELTSVIAHYGADIDLMLAEAVRPARDVFLAAAESKLKCYEGVAQALTEIRARRPDVPLVALTDAPRYVAMWKMNKLGILHHFDAIYGLPDPRLPTSTEFGRVKVDPEILLKHLQQSNFGFKGTIRNLPDEYEKPGTRGLKTVLMDFDMDEDPADRQRVLWVGDNLKKDVGLGRSLGVRTAWAKYGLVTDDLLKERLIAFSPPQNVHKNASLSAEDPDTPKPDYVLERFSDILEHV